jgi:hypothetical protein
VAAVIAGKSKHTILRYDTGLFQIGTALFLASPGACQKNREPIANIILTSDRWKSAEYFLPLRAFFKNLAECYFVRRAKKAAIQNNQLI